MSVTYVLVTWVAVACVLVMWVSVACVLVTCGASNLSVSNVCASNVGVSNVGVSNVCASNVRASNVRASNVDVSNVGGSNVYTSNVGLSNVPCHIIRDVPCFESGLIPSFPGLCASDTIYILYLLRRFGVRLIPLFPWEAGGSFMRLSLQIPIRSFGCLSIWTTSRWIST